MLCLDRARRARRPYSAASWSRVYRCPGAEPVGAPRISSRMSTVSPSTTFSTTAVVCTGSYSLLAVVAKGIELRPVAGVRRAIPRRIHGVRFAMTATARSERRIAVRGPGWALTPVPPRPIPPARRGDRPPGAARCRARPATQHCRGPQSPCPSRRPNHARCATPVFPRHRPGRGCAPRCARRARRRHRRAVRIRRCGYPRGSRCPVSWPRRASTKNSSPRWHLYFETVWCAIEPAWCPG